MTRILDPETAKTPTTWGGCLFVEAERQSLEAGGLDSPERDAAWTKGAHGMRGNSRLVGNSYSVYNANTINVTRVNNTYVVVNHGHGSSGGSKKHGARPHQGGKTHDSGRDNRPYKLWRYCVSCGIVDQHVAEGMSNGALMYESGRVMGRAASGIADNVTKMAGGLIECACGVASAAYKAIGAAFSVFD